MPGTHCCDPRAARVARWRSTVAIQAAIVARPSGGDTSLAAIPMGVLNSSCFWIPVVFGLELFLDRSVCVLTPPGSAPPGRSTDEFDRIDAQFDSDLGETRWFNDHASLLK